MSVTVVAVLLVAGAACLVFLTALYAAMRAAARGDRVLEGHALASMPGRQPDLDDVPPPRTGRFSRRARDRAGADAGDRPLVR